ncbi:MAG: TOBE domain-containing protein [Candidatus Methylomirabilales bacterium]
MARLFLENRTKRFDAVIASGEGGISLEAAGFSLRLPPLSHRFLEKYLGQRVTFGIRPEDIREAAATAPEATPARVEGVEPLGSEVPLDMRVGDHPVVARVTPQTRTAPHQLVHLSFSPERMHFFDPDTEEALG